MHSVTALTTTLLFVWASTHGMVARGEDNLENGGDVERAHGGPLVEACKGMQEGAQCTIESQGPETGDENVLGLCQKMLDDAMHCHILHPAALVCLEKEVGANCTFKHRGSEEQESGSCVKQPHGVVCHPSHAGQGPMHGGEGPGHHEPFVEACANLTMGDVCKLGLPSGIRNSFTGVCEEARGHGKKAKNEKEVARERLRCRMLSPMESACLGKEEGSECSLSMHAHGEEVSEEGTCKASVRGDLHCRHKPREKPQRHGRQDESGALSKALRGTGEGSLSGKNNPNLRKFPAPSHNHPTPSDHEDVGNIKAPAPKANVPAPNFNI